MNNLTLKQLRYFDALARHGHFGRAAEASSISQPALSMQIKDFEASLGTELFERGARGVQLTSFGQQVRAHAERILRAVDELGDLARADGEGLKGPLKLGVIPTIAPYILPRVIRELTGAFDAIDLQVRETLTPTLLGELQDGRLDAAILAMHYSKARQRTKAEVHYTPRKWVKKPKGAKPGLVWVTGGRSMRLRREEARLKRLMESRIPD